MSWQALSDRDLVCRKQHQCIWCGEGILAGQAMHLSVGKFDGDFQSNRYHPECWQAALDVFRSGEEEFSAGSFRRGTTLEE